MEGQEWPRYSKEGQNGREFTLSDRVIVNKTL